MRISLLTLVVAGLAALALAQDQYVPGGGGSYFPGYGGGDAYGHASTEAEGVQRGFADVVRSAGAANLMNSEAAKNYEDARKKYIENNLQATETFFEMRRVNKEARDAKRPRPLATEQYVRLARQQAPERLTVSQFDPVSGTIGWPSTLRAEKYSADRAAIEELLKKQVSGVASYTEEIQKACDVLLEKVKADVNSLGANDFIRAKKFVESLRNEVRLTRA